MMKVATFSALVLGLFGLCLLGLGGYLILREMHYLQTAVLTTGTVADLATSTSFQDQRYWTDYCPVIHFQTTNGQDEEYDSTNCQNPPAYKVGQKVDLYYDSQDPTNVQFHTFLDQYSAPTAAAVGGAFFLLLGLGVFWIGFLTHRRAAAARANINNQSGAARASSSADAELDMLAQLKKAEQQSKQTGQQGRRSR